MLPVFQAIRSTTTRGGNRNIYLEADACGVLTVKTLSCGNATQGPGLDASLMECSCAAQIDVGFGNPQIYMTGRLALDGVHWTTNTIG